MPPPTGPKRQPRVCVRYPFDFSFPPPPVTPVDFVADGTNQPPGGPGFTVEGTLYAITDVTFTMPLSDKIIVNVTQGTWSMGPFLQTGTTSLMMIGDYLLRVEFMQSGILLDDHVITTQLT